MMVARNTRNKKTASGETSSTAEAVETPGSTLGPIDKNPPHVVVLPKDASSSSRIITIDCLRRNTSTVPRRYFADPAKGLYEFTSVPQPKDSLRSWMFTPEIPDDGEQLDEVREGYIMSSPAMLIATPVDPVFVLLAIPDVLHSGNPGETRTEYESLENRMWTLRNKAPQLGKVLTENPGSRLEKTLLSGIKSVCDETKFSGDDGEYCLDMTRLTQYLMDKAERTVQRGLPQSLDDRFVIQSLEMPEISIRREDSGVSIVNVDGLEATVETSTSPLDVSTKMADISSTNLEHVHHLLRLRTTLDYIFARYFSSSLCVSIRKHLTTAGSSLKDFSPLDDRLQEIVKAKAEAQALRSISDNISRKRGIEDDEEAMEKQEAKKRKKEEEEQKKKSMSHGVKRLLKADTSGMQKLSAFFTKAPTKSK